MPSQKIIDALTKTIEERDQKIADLMTSTSWRITSPLRRAVNLALAIRRYGQTALTIVRQKRFHAVPHLIHLLRCRLGRNDLAGGEDAREQYRGATSPPNATLATRVLIIGALDLPQCEKYRVRQKQMLLAQLGVDCTALHWADQQDCMNALQTHSIVIFYRVPGFPSVLAMIREAKRLGLPTIYEVDDLIFDIESYLNNHNIYRLPTDLRNSVLNGVPLFRAALEACEFGIASTVGLAAKMKEAGLQFVHVIENGLDPETMGIVAQVLGHRASDPNLVRIFYGSGSKAHDTDFACAAEALLEIAEANPQVRLRIVGDVTLPTEFRRISHQIERLPATNYPAYLKLLAECDINVAPLEESVFNDCKSNIKFIEASLFEIPSVCSPRAAFRDVINHGKEGFLAESTAQWKAALEGLVRAPELRTRVGQLAKQVVLERYGPANLAERQIRPFLAAYSGTAESRLKILIVNVYFSPDSFGGGTIIAEEMATRLQADCGAAVTVFCASRDPLLAPCDVVRHEQKGLAVISAKVPPPTVTENDYENERMEAIFDDVLRGVRPDVVHFHSVQTVSASLARACAKAGVPYVITLHDAWWICERQFMIRPDHTYCAQTRISFDVCKTCVSDITWTRMRWNFLNSILVDASLLLAPSEFWRNIYVANQVPPEKIAVNRNGIRPPKSTKHPDDRRLLRFGFVGGIGPVKGLDLVIKAFKGITRRDYELVLVDNTMNLGFSSIRPHGWRLRGKVRVIPAYTQDTIDEFFSQIDVLLFPSQWKESFGLAVREALIRDKWVIVTDSGGTIEDVVDGENGTIIPLDGSHTALQVAIQQALDEPGRIFNHVNAYKNRIQTFDAQAAQLFAALKSCAQRTNVEQAKSI